MRRVERRKLRYIITPEGLALRARLTIGYIQNSFRLYRLVRERMIDVLDQIQDAGARCVRLEGDGDVAEVCRLTCLERGIDLDDDCKSPVLHIQGLKIHVDWDGFASRRNLNLHTTEQSDG